MWASNAPESLNQKMAPTSLTGFGRPPVAKLMKAIVLLAKAVTAVAVAFYTVKGGTNP